MKIGIKILLISTFFFLLAAGCSNQPVGDGQQMPRQQIQVSQRIDSERGDMLFNFYADENKTALDLLKSGHKVEMGTSSDTLETVGSINGVKPDKKHFWQFFVNGKASGVNAGSYSPLNGDKLEWRQSEIK